MAEPSTDLDWAESLRLAGDNPTLAEELLDMLMNNLSAEIQALQVAAAAAELGEVRERAHALHGATVYCGVPRLRLAARDVEEAAQSGQPELVRAELEQLETAATRLTAAYRQHKLTPERG